MSRALKSDHGVTRLTLKSSLENSPKNLSTQNKELITVTNMIYIHAFFKKNWVGVVSLGYLIKFLKITLLRYDNHIKVHIAHPVGVLSG